MSSLIIGFTAQMHKRVANSQEGTAPNLEISGDICPRSSRSEEEVQAVPTVINVESQERALEASSVVGGAVQDDSCAALADDITTGEPPRADDASVEASLVEAIDAPPQRARQALVTVDGVWRPPDRLVLS